MKNEIWKDIKNHEGFYQCSNYGRIRSLNRTVYFKNKSKRTYIGKILRLKIHNGYYMVNLHKYNHMQTLFVHRIIAETFIENKKNLPIINHIDGIKTNNHIENLEWCSYSENNKHARENKLTYNNLSGVQKINEEHKVSLLCSKNGIFIKKSDCSRNLAKWLIENNYITKTKNIESVARAIRIFSLNGKLYYGLKIERLNESISAKEIDSNIAIIRENKTLVILSNSNECANWLLKNNYIKNSLNRTIARSIRKAMELNKKYHGFEFKRI